MSKRRKSYVIIDNVAGTYRYYTATSVSEVVEEINRTHNMSGQREEPETLAIDELIGIPPRYQIVPVTRVYSVYT